MRLLGIPGAGASPLTMAAAVAAAMAVSMRVAAGVVGLAALLSFFLLPAPALAQDPVPVSLPVPVTFRVTVPAGTPAGDPIHVAGNFQNWDPGSASHRLAHVGERSYEITLPFAMGRRIEFKFTRGDWNRVEKGPKGEEIGNRVLVVWSGGVRKFTVANWRDFVEGLGAAKPSTITGNVKRVTVPRFLDGRRVWVYLPPGYRDEKGRRYPVLYMLDGQNVFDAATSFAGEWEVDESCERLIAAKEMRPIIVVAVANGETERANEYGPWYDAHHRGGAGGGAAEYLRAFRDVLIPCVNKTYRTRKGPESTGIGGSSMGGLLAMWAAYEHPDTFGRIAAVSPYTVWKDYELLRLIEAKGKPARARVYMDMGTLEWGEKRDKDGDGVDDAIGDLRDLAAVLKKQGFEEGKDLVVFEDPGGRHHEKSWSARFPRALKFLFPPE